MPNYISKYWIPIILITTYLYIASKYLVNWDINLSSDTVLIGLMAKSVIDHGDYPLFVWKVGYQGILLVVYLTSLIFKLFEASPFYLNFAPCFYLGLMIYFYYKLIKVVHDYQLAFVSSLVLIFSSPSFYHLFCRTMPNFAESSLLGILSILFYIKSLNKYYGIPSENNKYLIFISGLFAGLSMYTFELSIYYLGCILIHFTLIILFANFRLFNNYKNYVKFPNTTFKSVYTKYIFFVFDCLFVIIIAVDLIRRFFFEERLLLLIGRDNWPPDFNYMYGVFYFVLFLIFRNIYILFRLKKYIHIYKRFIKDLFFFIVGFVLIYFPPILYYRLILEIGHRKNIKFEFNLERISENMHLFNENHSVLLSVFDVKYFGYLVGLMLCVSILLLFKQLLKILKKYKKNKIIDFYDNLIIIYASFPFIILSLFLMLPSHYVSLRYLAPLSLFYSSFVFYWIFLISNKKLKKATLGIITIMIVLFGYKSIKSDIDLNKGINFKNIKNQINTLDKLGITKLYGDYWLSYPISFITKERIIIEPLYTNYNPYYLPIIKTENKVGLIVFKNSKYDPQNKKYTDIYDVKYKIEDKHEISSDVVIYELSKITI